MGRPLAGDADLIKEIFLGSTIEDLRDYRAEVCRVLSGAQINVFPSEKWVSSFTAVERKCRSQLAKAHAYFGLFGHWYGSIPHSATESITCLEFRWACEQWRDHVDPPVAVFLPQKGSAADRALYEEAERLLETNFPDEPAKQKEHRRRQVDFVAALCNWQMVNRFREERELCEQVLQVVLQWRGDLAKALLHGDAAGTGRAIDPVMLGRLGREDHAAKVARAIASVEGVSDAPAAALLLAGGEHDGQDVCLDYVLSTKRFRRGRGVRRGRPPSDCFDLDAVIRWMARQCGIELPAGAATVADLADGIHVQLKVQELIIALEGVERFGRGAEDFQKLIWQPLVARLAGLRVADGVRNRLFVLLTDFSGWKDAGADYLHDAGPGGAADDGRLLLMPALHPITETDLRHWLSEVEVPDDPPGRHDALVRIALHDSNRRPDGTPAFVHTRLNRERLWPNEEAL